MNATTTPDTMPAIASVDMPFVFSTREGLTEVEDTCDGAINDVEIISDNVGLGCKLEVIEDTPDVEIFCDPKLLPKAS